MALAFATPDDLRERLGIAEGDPLPANGQAMLDTANGLVHSAIANSIFMVDDLGFPAPSELTDACREAVLRQVSTWLSTGVSPWDGGPTGKPQAVQSKSALGASVTYAPDAQVSGYYQTLAGGSELIPWAMQALEAEGLGGTVIVGDGGGYPRPFMRHYPWDYVIDGGEG